MAGVSGGWGASEQAGGLRKGPWTAEEDRLLHEYVDLHGEGRWSTVARSTGLNRSGKSCRLRWVNYLKPGLKKGQLTPQEQAIIIELHSLWGNKWSMIARCLPGRTDNEIKNYWRTHFKNKADKCSQSEEKKPRNRAMRRQKLLKAEQEQQKQLQQQQQQHQQEEQQEKQEQQHQAFEDKNIQSDEMEAEVGDGYRVALLGLQDDVQEQEMFMCSSSNLEDQCLPVMFHQGGGAGSVMPEDMFMCGGDQGIWSGLWNLDDDEDEYDVHQAQAHFDRTRGCSSSNNKVTMQNQNQFIPSNFYGGQFK